MADVVIQRVVFPLDPQVSSLYYRAMGSPHVGRYRGPVPRGRRSIVLGRGAGIDTNTYFNSFFEAYWRRHTTLGSLLLRVQVSGQGTIRLWRAFGEREASQLGQVDFKGENQTVELDVPEPSIPGGAFGRLFFEVIARSDSVTILSADWVALEVEPSPVKLVAGYCTFNRETFVLNNIRSLTDDVDLAERLVRIVVVDQGTRKVKSRPEYEALPLQVSSRVHLVEQGNFGGTGGFTRCILETMRMQGATHVLLLDDDAVVEPESVFRAAAFFALANSEIALGGAMLDLLQPLKMFEAGGFVRPERMGVDGRGRNLSLDEPDSLRKLADVEYSHYNAWWFFACPLSTAERLGLPLPLFIRGDDLEYGCRLMRAGVTTFTLPGLGVWHLPFYMKERGWTEYYSQRNMLVVIAIHFAVSRFVLASTFLRVLLHRLLTLDYFKAWGLCEGMEDYLTGPSVLRRDSERIHQRVLETHRRMSGESLPKNDADCRAATTPIPRSYARQLIGLAGGLLRQLLRASPDKQVLPPTVMAANDEHWYRLCKADVAVIDDRHSERYFVLRRDRGQFLGFLARGVRLALQLLFTHGRVVRRWQIDAKALTEPRSWRKYLGMTGADGPTLDSADGSHPSVGPGLADAKWGPVIRQEAA